MLGAAVHSERVLDLLFIVEDEDGCTSEQEQMSDLGVDFGDDIVVLRWKEARDLVEL